MFGDSNGVEKQRLTSGILYSSVVTHMTLDAVCV